MEAQNIWLSGGNYKRSDPLDASFMYKMGCVALDMGKLEAAM